MVTQTMLATPWQTNIVLPSPFWVACEFVAQNSDPVHVATAIKVDLQLIGSRPIIHLFPFQTDHAVFTEYSLSTQVQRFPPNSES